MPKILLFEDNKVNRDMLTRQLQRYGHQVVSSGDETEVLPKARAEVPDLVLIDMNMPAMDGREATRQIKEDNQLREIPVLALTTHTTAGDENEVLAAGCDGYDTKPIDFKRLIGKIELLLPSEEAVVDDSRDDNGESSQTSNARLEQLMLNHLRHELCTPINSIIGYSEILLDEFPETVEVSRYQLLEEIHAAGLQLLASTDMVLNAEQLKVHRITQDIDSFGVRVRLELLAPLGVVIDYCQKLTASAPTEQVTADLNRIDTAAQQLLVMVNDIVLLAQQQLQTLSSQPSILTRMPTGQVASQAFAHTASKLMRSVDLSDTDSIGGNILVVDDNQLNCDLLSRQLERQGYIVTTVSRGAEALQYLREIAYDLVLLDIFMPDMNGLDVLSEIKQSSALKAIPVIMISAIDELDSVVRCIEMGAEDFLSKPFNPILLQAKIKASLEKKQFQEQAAMCAAQRVVAGATPTPIFISRIQDGQILYANLAAESAIGLSVSELLNRTTVDFYANSADRQEIVAAVSKQETVYRQEVQCKRANGETFWAAASMQPLMFENEPTVLSVLYDISDRKKAEQALSLAEESYRSIFEHALEGIFQATPDGSYIRVNPTLARIYGFASVEDMMQLSPILWNKAWVNAQVKADYQRTLSQFGRIEALEYQCRRWDGRVIWLEENSRVVCDQSGKTLYYEGIVQDITERKSSEVALEREVKKLRVEIDQVKREQDVKKISQMDYFQHLMAEADSLRLSAELF